MHIKIIMEKVAVNLKENKEGSVERFGGRKGKGEIMLCNYIIISKIREKKRSGKVGAENPGNCPMQSFIYIVHTILCLILNPISHHQATLPIAIIRPEAIKSSLFFSSITHFKLPELWQNNSVPPGSFPNELMQTS